MAFRLAVRLADDFVRERRKWTIQATAFYLVAITVAATGPAAAQMSPETDTRSMAFDQCLSVIQTSATDLGVAPVTMVETATVRMVRFLFADGSVQITCSAIGSTMAVTLSPRVCGHGGDC